LEICFFKNRDLERASSQLHSALKREIETELGKQECHSENIVKKNVKNKEKIFRNTLLQISA